MLKKIDIIFFMCMYSAVRVEICIGVSCDQYYDPARAIERRL